MKFILFIRQVLGRHTKTVLYGSVFVLITNILQVLIPSLIGDAVDALKDHFLARDILRISAIILVLELLKCLSRFLMRYIIIGASWHVENDIRLKLYGHLLKLPVSFYNRSRTGDIIARVTNDLTAVRAMAGPGVMYSINVMFLAPAALFFMFTKDWRIALYGIMPFPFIALMIYFAGKRIHVYFRSVQESYSDISAHIQENLNGIRMIKAYVREKFELSRLRELSQKYVMNNKKVIRLQSFYHPFIDVLASTGVLVVLWFGGKRVINGETTLGVLVSMIMYIAMLVWPSIAVGWVVAVFQRGTASMKRINDILEEEPERQDEKDILDRLKGDIRVDSLTFSYNDEKPVLKDISFDLKAGRTLAIVGRTGSGKTTLLSLLAGLYDTPHGHIQYDGIDITDLPLSHLRASIAYVPQESFLFSESVAENIAFGKEDADNTEIKRAAVLAAIAGEIDEYPDGYDTMLGERGLTVSGGQRQRLTIARSLISDAEILFFDDCLSNVDTRTEMTILDNIKTVIRGKTAVIVTHRLGAVKDADEILYLSGGEVIERGNHEDLMKIGGEYAALFDEQETLDRMEAEK